MRLRTLLLLALAGLLAFPALASGADRIYWTNATDNAVKFGNLDGSGSATTLFGSEANPLHGIALDPVLNRAYWANEGSDAIRTGATDGSGAASDFATGEGDPIGLAVDTTSGKIYWTDFNTGAIRVADDLGGKANLFTGESQPRGVAVDTANGKIYWTSQGSASIRVGSLNGSGSPSTLFSGNPANNLPTGVAVDAAAGKIYWADVFTDTISVANLNGSGSPAVLYSGEADPTGVALDHSTGRLYWTANGGGIRVGSLDGATPAADLYPNELGAQYAAVLRTPVGTGRPAISGGGQVGQQLSCSSGNWADDDPGAFLYRQPSSHSFQWQRNGVDISGATSSAFTPTQSGTYTCTVAGSNAAGSAQQTSSGVTINPGPPVCSAASATATAGSPAQVSLQCAGEGTLTFAITAQPQQGQVSGFNAATGTLTYTPNPGFTGQDTISYTASNAGGPSNAATLTITVLPAAQGNSAPPSGNPGSPFGITGFQRNRRRGSGVLTIQVPGPGLVHLQGRGVQPAFDRAGQGGTIELNVRPKASTRHQLAERGRSPIRLLITYTPNGGAEAFLRHSYVLVRSHGR